MDESVLTRVFLAGEFMRSGVALSQRRMPADRVLCVIQLDLGLELLLNTVLSAKHKDVGKRDLFLDLVDKVCELDDAYGGHRSALKRLHLQRDRVQHDGLPPSEETCRVLAAEAEAAFRAIVEIGFGIEANQLSLEALVEAEKVRACLEAARLALAEGKADQACLEAATAFVLARGRAVEQMFRRGASRATRDVMASILGAVAEAAGHAHGGHVGSSRGNELREWVNSFVSYLRRGPALGFADPLESLVEPIVLWRFDVDLEELRRFEQVTPRVAWALPGNRIHTWCGEKPTFEDAEFALAFATRCALKFQASISRSRERPQPLKGVPPSSLTGGPPAPSNQ